MAIQIIINCLFAKSNRGQDLLWCLIRSLLVQLGVEGRLDWSFSRRKPPEENFWRQSPSSGWRVGQHTGAQNCRAPVLCLLKKCLIVSSFHFTNPKLRPSNLLMRTCMQMRLCCIYWTCICVHRGSAWLTQCSGVLDGIPERAFAWACTTWLNHRGSAKVLFSNIYLVPKFFLFPTKFWF